MKLLAFEDRYRLETEECRRCDGSGVYGDVGLWTAPVCWSCRGMGRKPTPRALQLYYLICELLGSPVEPSGRIEPDHLGMLFGSQLKAGMRVRPLKEPGTPPRVIARIEVTRFAAGSLVLRFTDGNSRATSQIESFERTLTQQEIGDIQNFMQRYVGAGVVEAPQ